MRFCVIISAFSFIFKTNAAGHIKFDVEKKIGAANSQGIGKRAASPAYAQLTQNNKLEYLINITVGQPGQTLGVTLDTGSSGLWIPSKSFCQLRTCDHGSFDPRLSTSYKVLDAGKFNISYAAPGDWDAGDWSSDSINVGGATLTDQIFALAQTGQDSHGVMGISIDPQPPFGPSGMSTYPTLVTSMVRDGYINRRAYSLYLNSYNQTFGSIIFGGIDNTKYSGSLYALPLQSGRAGWPVGNVYVTLTKMTFNDAAGLSTVLTPDGYAQMVLLDSGSSYTTLTNSVMERLANGIGAMTFPYRGGLYVPCQYRGSNASITYTFGGLDSAAVTVPLSETIAPSAGSFCDLAFGPQYGAAGLNILGDSFLRSAYVVYDIDNQVAAIGQAIPGVAGTSSIIAIPTGTAIPGVISTASASGTQLSGAALSQTASFFAVSRSGTSLVTATPTFNLGAATTMTSSSTSTSTSTSSVSNAAPGLLLSDCSQLHTCMVAVVLMMIFTV